MGRPLPELDAALANAVVRRDRAFLKPDRHEYEVLCIIVDRLLDERCEAAKKVAV